MGVKTFRVDHSAHKGHSFVMTVNGWSSMHTDQVWMTYLLICKMRVIVPTLELLDNLII